MTTDKRPQGAWTCALKRARLREGEQRLLVVDAVETVGRGAVRATIFIGNLVDLELNDWGIPEDVPADRIWYLQNLTPGSPTCRGGTTELFRYIALRADADSAYVTTMVQPGEPDVTRVLVRLLRGVGFKSRPGLPFVMVRRPRKAPARVRRDVPRSRR